MATKGQRFPLIYFYFLPNFLLLVKYFYFSLFFCFTSR